MTPKIKNCKIKWYVMDVAKQDTGQRTETVLKMIKIESDCANLCSKRGRIGRE